MNDHMSCDKVTKGACNWVFCDGELPPKDDGPLDAHEALMVVNLNEQPAHLSIDILFENMPPKSGIHMTLQSMRVASYHLDQPLGEVKYQIPSGQYALALHSDLPVFAVFGRLDVRQPNLAYYSVQGHSYE